MSWYNNVKSVIGAGVGVVSGYVGQVVLPAYVSPIARAAGTLVFKFLTPAPASLVGKLGYNMGMKSFAEGCGYQAFKLATGYGGIAGGLAGVAATNLAFKGVEYGAECLAPHLRQSLERIQSYFNGVPCSNIAEEKNVISNEKVIFSDYISPALAEVPGSDLFKKCLRVC